MTAYLVKFTGHLQRKLIVKVDDRCGHFMWLLKSYAQGIVGFSPLAHRGLQRKQFSLTVPVWKRFPCLSQQPGDGFQRVRNAIVEVVLQLWGEFKRNTTVKDKPFSVLIIFFVTVIGVKVFFNPFQGSNSVVPGLS